MRYLLLVAALTLAIACVPLSASAEVSASASTKKCKKGYKRVKVGHGRKAHLVCKKVKKTKAPAQQTPVAPTNPAPEAPAPGTPAAPEAPAGPSVAEVETIIRDGLQAQHLPSLGPDSIAVTFEQPTQVLAPVSYDPYANDPLHAGGAIQAWPVRAWVKSVNNHDSTPADDTHYYGCDGHLDSAWPHDQLYMFMLSDAGGWTFKTTPAGSAIGSC